MDNLKNKAKSILSLGSVLCIIIIIYLITLTVSALSSDKVDREACPYKVEGNVNSNFTIMYVDSPYCFWCWLEEPILARLVETKGASFQLQKYDIRYCKDIIRKYRISGTPSFVFSIDNGKKEYTHVGFIKEEDFGKIVCEITGNCN